MEEDSCPILDLRGYRCPMPVIRTEQRLRAMATGEKLRVLADDPVAVVDLPHFCNQAGHHVAREDDINGAFAFRITAGGTEQ